MKLWQTGEEELSGAVEKFTAGEDVKYDQKLSDYDILGNLAHVKMLHEKGFLGKQEFEEIKEVLKDIYGSDINLSPSDEDIHTKVENLVTEMTEAGKKMHTGRSRNDQVMVDIRLYSKDKLVEFSLALIELIVKIVQKAEESSNIVMPGYTHMRQAMPTTAEVWLGSFAESLLDDLSLLEKCFQLNDQSPLGAAAGFGTTLDLDREMTAELLGFSSVQNNPIYCVSSRGKFELEIISSLKQVMLDLSRLAIDLILFSMPEFGFVEIPEEFCTGSSIMPQKKNPDVLETVKAKASKVMAMENEIGLNLKNQISGYNRDVQGTKACLMESFSTAMETVKIMSPLVGGLSFDQSEIDGKIQDGVYAAYTANKEVESGKPFRDAYKETKHSEDYEKPSPEKVPSAELPELDEEKEKWKAKEKEIESTVEKLLSL